MCWPRRCSRSIPAPRSPSARPSRTASITTSPATRRSRRRISPPSRRACARSSPANAPFERQVWDRDEAIAFFEARGERYKAELIRDLPESETITLLQPGRLDRPLPRPAHARHRRRRHRLQAAEGGRGVLARRPPQPDAEPHLRHRLARPEASSTRICACWRRPRSATTGASARTWACSTSRRRRSAACSGTRRAGACTARRRPICAAGWTRPATRR